MKLSMIVTTTSCAPVKALSAPGMKPQERPQPATTAGGAVVIAGRGPVRNGGADHPCAERTHEQLAAGPDVEQAGLEADANR